MERIQYLGYRVDEHGIHVDPTKIQDIHAWLASITLIELRGFLGLANFYCWFVLGFFHIAWPLIQVTKGGAKAKFAWGISNIKCLRILNDAFGQFQSSLDHTYNKILRLRHMTLTMVFMQSSINMDI